MTPIEERLESYFALGILNNDAIDIVSRANTFGMIAHMGQQRKYTGENYFDAHCKSVAAKVEAVTTDKEIIAAALLHDTVEDTEVTHHDIMKYFGVRVMRLVRDLTEITVKEDGNRAYRKQLELEHLSMASDDAKTIKLADLIDNTSSITERDPEFARVYMAEKRALLKVLAGGDDDLYDEAEAIVNKYYEEHEQC